MQATRADVFLAFVDVCGDFGEAVYGFRCEHKADAFGVHQFHILLGQRGLGLGQNAHEILFAQRAQFHPDREAALHLWNQIRRLGQMKCTTGNKQNMVGVDRAVFGAHGAAFHQRQQVALHAFA